MYTYICCVYKKQVSEKIHFMFENAICFTYNLFLILADSHLIGGGSCHIYAIWFACC